MIADAQRRATFLAEASRVLASSLELEQTLGNVARLAVPLVADWCAVDLLDEAGDLVRVAVEHPDPAHVQLAHRLRERYPEDRGSPHGVWEVLRSGRAQWMADIPESLLERAAVDAEHLEIIRRLQLRSYVIAPLTARGNVLGAITFVYAESGRRYTESDLELAEELARRAAVAIDNARLLRESERARERLAEQHAQLGRQHRELQELASELEAQAVELESQLEVVKLLNAEVEAARAEAVRLQEYVSSVLEGISDPLVVHDAEWRFRYVNRAAATIFDGFGRTDLTGCVLWEEYPELRGTSTERELQRAMRERIPVAFEDFSESTGRWTEMRCYPLADGGVATVWKDVTARKRAERDARFLADASRLLASSLDYHTTLVHLAELAVPELADWCMIDMLEEDGRIARVITLHPDPARRAWAESVHESVAPALTDEVGIGHVVRTGRPQLLPEITPEMIERAAPTPVHRAVWSRLDMRSSMTVPLRARDRVLGALTFIASESGRRYQPDDLQLAIELGVRAGTAVENAMLYRQAHEASRAKSDFLAVMSHELRTPLNAILGYSDLLTAEVTGPLNDAQKHQLARLNAGARQLVQLIDQILSLSRIEAGKEQVFLVDCDLVEVLSEAVAMLEPAAAKRGIRLEARFPHELPMRTDPGKVRQILLNLLSNAVKFTEEGSVLVSAGTEDQGVVVEVVDTGVGIAPQALPHVFEPFVQVDSSPTRRHGGSGLGLAVSRDLARLLAGTLTADSAPGKGSRFTLRLPDHRP